MATGKDKPLRLVRDDPWIEPASEEITARYNRYLDTIGEISAIWKDLKPFRRQLPVFTDSIMTGRRRGGFSGNGRPRPRTSIFSGISTAGSVMRTG